MTFRPNSESVDYILLANQKSPGLAVVSNASSPRRWDERKGYALSGGRVVFRGIGISRPVVTFTLLSDEDWEGWHNFRPLVQRPPLGVRARAMDIWHPILEDLGIVSVVVANVSQPRQVNHGEWTVDVDFIEFRRPKFTIEVVAAAAEKPTLTDNEQRISSLRNQNTAALAANRTTQ